MKKTKKSFAKQMKKAVPIAVFSAMLASTSAFAAQNYDYIEVVIDNKVMRYNIKELENNTTYRQQVKNAVKKAFEGGDKFIVQDERGTWFDIGKNFKDGTSLDVISDNPAYFEGKPDPDAEEVAPETPY